MKCCKEHIVVHEVDEGWAVDGGLIGNKNQAIAYAVKMRDSMKVPAGEVKPFVYIELSQKLQLKMPAGVWA